MAFFLLLCHCMCDCITVSPELIFRCSYLVGTNFHLQRSHITVSLSTWVLRELLSYTKPVSAMNLEYVLPLQFRTPHFVDERWSADLQLLKRLPNFWTFHDMWQSSHLEIQTEQPLFKNYSSFFPMKVGCPTFSPPQLITNIIMAALISSNGRIFLLQKHIPYILHMSISSTAQKGFCNAGIFLFSLHMFLLNVNHTSAMTDINFCILFLSALP